MSAKCAIDTNNGSKLGYSLNTMTNICPMNLHSSHYFLLMCIYYSIHCQVKKEDFGLSSKELKLCKFSQIRCKQVMLSPSITFRNI